MANIKISELNPLLTVEDADVLPIVDNAVTKKVTAAILRTYTEGNSVLLTGAQTIAGIKTFTSQLASSVATGTAPFSVASTTKVTNLNADLLDGLSSAAFQGALTLTTTGSSGASTLNTNTLNIPNYTIGGLGGVPYTGATQDVNLGLFDLYTAKVWLKDVPNDTYGSMELTDGVLHFEDGDGHSMVTMEDGYLTIANASTIRALLDVSALSVNRDFAFPNASGTLALTSDLTAYVPTTRTVSTTSPLTGGGALSSNLTLSIGQSTASTNGYLSSADWTTFNAKQNTITLTTTGTSGAATLVGSTLNIPNYADTDTGITSLNGLTALTQTFAVGTSGTDFGISSATSTHTFNLPTASASNRGALSSADWTTFNNKASTADLANYLPLAGGTLTGALNGTSANFTSTLKAVGDSLFGASNLTRILSASQVIDFTNAAQDTYVAGRINGLSLKLYGNNGTGIDITSAGNVLIGTTTDAGYKLDVNGTGRFTGISTGAYLLLNAPSSGGTITMQADGVSFADIGSELGNFGTGSATNLCVSARSGKDLILGGGALKTLTLASTGAATFSSSVTTGADATINGVSIGKGAGNLSDNTAIGASALASNTTGLYNTAIGVSALTANLGGDLNIAIGRLTLGLNITGTNNTAVGANRVMNNNTTGSYNTALGNSALYENSSASANVAIGYNSLFSNTVSNNTAVGYESAYSNTSGVNITAIGYRALKNSTGNSNTAVGIEAGSGITTGTSNTILGQQALVLCTTGSGNTAIGAGGTLYNNTASNNTAVGFEAAFSNTSGGYNTALGYQSLKLNTTGEINVAIGYQSLSNTTTGSNNTALGVQSLQNNTTGSNNSAIGYNTQTGNFSGSVILGVSAIATASNQFVVGSSSVNAGAIATEVVISDTTWSVRINGTAYKILLKA
jgi:hypothetical protein